MIIQSGPDIYNTLLGNYIGYDRLYAMTVMSILYDDRKDSDEINLYIDLNSYLKRIWDPRPFSYKADNVLVASIINACAHYRNYFFTRHMVKTNIYLIWGYNTPDYQPVEYNAHFRERVATNQQAQELLEMTKKSLEFLCPYLPQIYFIDCGKNEVSAMMYNLIQERLGISVVLTKDVYAYQLVAYCPATFVYRPKKIHDPNVGIVDTSWVVTKRNLFRAFKHEMDYKIIADEPDNVRNLEYVLALSGLRKRHVKGIMTFNRACTTVMNMEDDRPECFDDIYSFENTLLFNCPDRCRGIGVRGAGDLVNRRNMLSVVSAAEMLKRDPAYINMMASIQDLYNPQAVMEISDKEFVEYPLELMEL